MTTTSFDSATPSAAQRWMLPGLNAGFAFLAVELAAGALSTSLWRFPEAIADVVGVPPAHSLIVGITIHFIFSLGLGTLFVAIADRFLRSRGHPTILLAGLMFMWLESPISIWLVLNTLYPTTLPILFAAVPFWASFVGRNLFGLVLAESYWRLVARA